MQLRASPTDYTFFCDFLLGCVTGMKRFAKDSRSRNISEIATVSDEAFALVLLDNNYKVWLDMVSNGITKGSTVDPEYTNGGNSMSNGRSRKYKGWSDAGIDQYNALFDRVQEDRTERPDFEKSYLEKKKEDWKKAGEGKRKWYRADEEIIIPSKARHELWEEVKEKKQVKERKASGDSSDSETEASLGDEDSS